MPKNRSTVRRKQLKAEAEARAEQRKNRTDVEQFELLDQRRGASVKERARLLSRAD